MFVDFKERTIESGAVICVTELSNSEPSSVLKLIEGTLMTVPFTKKKVIQMLTEAKLKDLEYAAQNLKNISQDIYRIFELLSQDGIKIHS